MPMSLPNMEAEITANMYSFIKYFFDAKELQQNWSMIVEINQLRPSISDIADALSNRTPTGPMKGEYGQFEIKGAWWTRSNGKMYHGNDIITAEAFDRWVENKELFGFVMTGSG